MVSYFVMALIYSNAFRMQGLAPMDSSSSPELCSIYNICRRYTIITMGLFILINTYRHYSLLRQPI
jgi:hypothetical protein